MKFSPRTLFVGLVVGVGLSAAFADDYPFSGIANLPEKKFIGFDQHGYPHIADKDKGTVAQIATSDQSPEYLRSLAVWGLAISGYSPESAEGLVKVATSRTFSDQDRGIAAMGLSNFTLDLPANTKEEFRSKLRETIKSEGPGVADSIVRALLAWGDAPWVAEQFGDALTGHRMEIEILQQLPAATATPRLLEIYRAVQRDGIAESYNRRAAIGRALVNYGDKRGIDILDTLLDAELVPTNGGAANHQYRHNVFAAIQKAVGRKFGYEQPSYQPTIDDAILLFREWWFRERYEFEFHKP